jgi:hypothetical protein
MHPTISYALAKARIAGPPGSPRFPGKRSWSWPPGQSSVPAAVSVKMGHSVMLAPPLLSCERQ